MNPDDTSLTVPCACGCGTMLPPLNKLGQPSRYAHGHNTRGRIASLETRQKISRNTTEQMRKKFGPPSHPWARYGTTPGYKDWRRAVLTRDDFTCQSCGKKLRSCFLHAHHIKSWADYPDLRLDITNGQTLCVFCHNLAHGWRVGKEPQPCACGCGELCDPRFKFRHGHWTRVRKGVLTRKGMKNSPETRHKISEALTGIVFTPERKANISKAKKGKSIKGHPHTEESKEALSAGKKTQYEDPEFAARMGQSIHEAWLRKQADVPPVFCACGCGEQLPPRKPGGRQNRFLFGHSTRRKILPEETRTKKT